MDTQSAILTAIKTVAAVMEEVRLDIAQIKEQMAKNDENRMKLIELELKNLGAKVDAWSASDKAELKSLGIKVDTLSAADIVMPVVHMSGKTAVRTETKGDSKTPAEPERFATITEFFKHMWVTKMDDLKAKGLVTDKDVEDDVNARKGAENGLKVRRRLANTKWQSYTDQQQNTVRAMKKEYESLQLQRSTVSLQEEKKQ